MLAAVASVVSAAFSACNPGVQCGAVLTRDTTLTRDLVGCPTDGVVIGADDITLDLAGHTIVGMGQEGPDLRFRAGSEGVRVAGREGVVVKGGRVEGFETGVSLVDTRSSTVQSITAYIDDVGVRLNGSNANVVSGVRSDFSQNSGYLLAGSHGNRIVDSVSNDGWRGGIGLSASHYNTVARNRARVTLTSSNGNLIERNQPIPEANDQGLWLDRSHRNRIEYNTTVHELVSLWDSSGNRVVGNTFGGKLDVVGGDDNLLAYNTARWIWVLAGWNDLATGNDVVVNRVASASGWSDGILVTTADYESLFSTPPSVRTDNSVTDNVVTGSQDDGIDVDAPGVRIANNTANDNGDLGIEAVPGVIDGGGNRAATNGNPAQCTYVTCS
jgi:hypothetical protein